jgi:hypothetical protein
VHRQKEDASKRHYLNLLLEKPNHEATVRGQRAGHAESQTNIQNYRIRTILGDFVFLSTNVPVLKQRLEKLGRVCTKYLPP